MGERAGKTVTVGEKRKTMARRMKNTDKRKRQRTGDEEKEKEKEEVTEGMQEKCWRPKWEEAQHAASQAKKHKRWMSRKEIRVEKEKKTWLNGNGKIMRSRERAAVGEEWPCTLKVDSRNLYLSSVWNLPGYFVNIQQTVREVNCFASHWSELH